MLGQICKQMGLLIIGFVNGNFTLGKRANATGNKEYAKSAGFQDIHRTRV
jgi:hypothetical protein